MPRAEQRDAGGAAGSDHRPVLCVFGAAPDNPNLGVRALCESLLTGIARRSPEALVTVFDDGWGVREDVLRFDGADFAFRRCGHRRTRRIHRSESHVNMRVSAAFGGLGNSGVRLVDRADAVLDVSGGDSFADLYGPRRFRSVAFPKEFTLRRRRPLVLLPQTYGPFRDGRHRRRAQKIVAQATLAWARDSDSFDSLRRLAGDDFDPERHRLGVDLAFALPAREPANRPSWLDDWLRPDRDEAVVGLNVSGLLYNDPRSMERFGLADDYRLLVQRLVRQLVDAQARVVLVSHVGGGDPIDADPSASESVRAVVGRDDRVRCVDSRYDAAETKWVISKLDWFCGSRMHATIAALSSGVPVVNVAYSDKAAGVFASAGQRDAVIDARRATTDEAVESILTHFSQRADARRSLREHLPLVLDRAERQIDDTLAVV